MPITDTLLEHSTTEFSTNWIHRMQQTSPRLMSFVDYMTFMGERKRFDRIGAQVDQEKTDRKGPTRITNVDMDSRWAYRKNYDVGNLLDEDDTQNLGQLILPDGDYVKSHANAYHRRCDQVAVDTALGSVKIGADGTTDYAFDTTNQKIVDGGTGLTLAKLLQVNEILEDADLEDGAPRVCVYTAKQMTNLLNTTEVKSSDYNTVKALAAGTVDTFMGFKFVKFQGVKIAGVRYGGLPKTGNVRTLAFWVKGAIRITQGAKSTSIKERADLSDAVQIRSKWHVGGTRVYDEGVVAVDCVES